ncbi:MAG TPA: hypothetical protein VNM67_12900 [Thermoanaerobaculia bacterium]|jgi:hypothetical protein|nr:hypothetical protein [Thermoanaerobaculia bacterium]
MRHGKAWTLALALLLLGGCAGTRGRGPGVPLITEEEAAMPDAPEERDRQVCGPPEIQIRSPLNGRTYPPPVPVEVRFIPSSGARIDPSTIRIGLIKLGMKIDLTERAHEYISASGISLPRAEIPTGRYRVQVTVGDSSGRKCSETVQFTVAP